MNAFEIIERYLTSNVIDSDLYISKKNGHKYRFIEPVSIQYQGDCAWYEDLETGKKELVYGGDLESLARKEPNKIMKEIEKREKEKL